MKNIGISTTKLSYFLTLKTVSIIFDEGRSHNFEILSDLESFECALVNINKIPAELKSVGSDFFATYNTELGKVTYIFCTNGFGYKIGPGSAQQKFEWQ